MAITSGWVSDNYGTGMTKNVDAAMSAGAAAQTAPFERIQDAFTALPTGTGIGDGSAAVKTVSSPGPANAGPTGPAPTMVTGLDSI